MNNALGGSVVIALGLGLMYLVMTGKIDRVASAWKVLTGDQATAMTTAPSSLSLPRLPALPPLQRV